jgi:lipoprotein-anchoring transpeptidase ErfK/SrfK
VVATTFTSVPAKITAANIGKAIIVDESRRTVRLYSGARVEKGYRCAVGQPRYPTPKGTFKIIAKAMNPAWHNPGSDWARSMPAYIPPGPSNPLGTRALYLNVSGIRIHGTNKISSIGTAASHGCIRMANSDIENLYPRVPVGIPVFIIK